MGKQQRNSVNLHISLGNFRKHLCVKLNPGLGKAFGLIPPQGFPQLKTKMTASGFSLHFLGRIAALNMLAHGTEISTVPYLWTSMFGKSIRYAGKGNNRTHTACSRTRDCFAGRLSRAQSSETGSQAENAVLPLRFFEVQPARGG